MRKSVVKIPELAAAAENRNKAVGNRRMADKRKVKMTEIGFRMVRGSRGVISGGQALGVGKRLSWW